MHSDNKKKVCTCSLYKVGSEFYRHGICLSLFESFAYNPIVLGIMILLFIPTIVSINVSAGFISSVVIIMHIYSEANFTLELFLNELTLMAIGFGTGLAVNMYMGDYQKDLERYIDELETIYRSIFSEIVKYLRNGDTSWDGKELIEAENLLNRAKSLAFKDVENHLTRKQNEFYLYFDMRERQFEIIERVLPKITTLPVMVQQAELVADFMEDLAENVHSGNTAKRFREKLEIVKKNLQKCLRQKLTKNFLQWHHSINLSKRWMST